MCIWSGEEGGRPGFSRKQEDCKEQRLLHTWHAQPFLPNARAQGGLDNSLHLPGLEDDLNAGCPAPRFNTLQDGLHSCYIATFGVLTFIIPQGHKNVLPFTEYTASELLGPPTHRHLKGPQWRFSFLICDWNASLLLSCLAWKATARKPLLYPQPDTVYETPTRAKVVAPGLAWGLRPVCALRSWRVEQHISIKIAFHLLRSRIKGRMAARPDLPFRVLSSLCLFRECKR